MRITGSKNALHFRFKCSKLHRFLGLRPRPRWGSLRRSPRPPSREGLLAFGNRSFAPSALALSQIFSRSVPPKVRYRFSPLHLFDHRNQFHHITLLVLFQLLQILQQLLSGLVNYFWNTKSGIDNGNRSLSEIEFHTFASAIWPGSLPRFFKATLTTIGVGFSVRVTLP